MLPLPPPLPAHAAICAVVVTQPRDLRRAFGRLSRSWGMPSKASAEEFEPVGEWLTVKEVAAWLKVSEHHVYQTLRRMPGCEPINVGKSQKQPDLRFNRYRLAAALSLPRSR